MTTTSKIIHLTEASRPLATVFADNQALRDAVDLWLDDKLQAMLDYGHVSDWNVLAVTDMSFLFYETDFCDDVSQWDVSSVVTMKAMFQDAPQFQSDVSHWQVTRVTDFSHMFHGATLFDGDVSTWDVGYSYSSDHGNLRRSESESMALAAINMESMFESATAFDGDLTRWETGTVVNMQSMFRNAVTFDCNLRHWDTAAVDTMRDMFRGAKKFSQQLCWKIRDDADTVDMMEGSQGRVLTGSGCTIGTAPTSAKGVVTVLDSIGANMWAMAFTSF